MRRVLRAARVLGCALTLMTAALPGLASAASAAPSAARSPDILVSISGTLAPGTEQDWGPYFLAQGQSLTVTLNWTPGSAPMAVDLCDPNNNCTHVPVSGGSSDTQFFADATGNFTVVIENDSGSTAVDYNGSISY